MRKVKTLLMMAVALLFTGAAFAQAAEEPALKTTLGQVGESLQLVEGGTRSMGIYQQVSVRLSEDFIEEYEGEDKVITVTYGEVNPVTPARTYKDKVEYLVEENQDQEVTILVLDYLRPKTAYTYTVTVKVGGREVASSGGQFVSYLGDLADPLPNIISMKLLEQKADVTVSGLKNVKTITGEPIVLDEASFDVTLTNERLAQTETLAEGETASEQSFPYTYEDAEGEFLVFGDNIVAEVALTYNGKTLTRKATQGFGSDEMNPLWVYVVPANSGTKGQYDIVVKGMPHPVTVTSADIQVQTKKVDEDDWSEVYGVSRAIQADEEQFRVLASELKVKDADVFDYPEEGFDFRLVIGFWVSGEHYEFTLDNAHAIFDPYAYAFNFVPRWNNGNPDLYSKNINKTTQDKVKTLVNSLITDGYWDGSNYPEDIDFGAKVDDNYYDAFTQQPDATLANVSIPLSENLSPADGLTENDSVWVEWEYYVIYEKWQNHNFYPEVIAIEPHIYEQTFEGAIFEDWAYSPMVENEDGSKDYFFIKGVRVFLDEENAGTVEFSRPTTFNNGERMKTITAVVYMKDNSYTVNNPGFVEVGRNQFKVNPNKTNKTYVNRVAVDASSVIKKDYNNYCEVKVVVYGNDYVNYTAETTDVFSAPNRAGVAKVTEIEQPVSFTLQRLNVNPLVELTGFKGEYKVYGSLQKLEANEDGTLKLVDGEPVPVGEPVEAPVLYRTATDLNLNLGGDITDGLKHTDVTYTEDGFLFPNVDEETWYQANIEFEYAAIRDILDEDGEVVVDTVWMKGKVQFADGVNNPFKTVKVPAAGDIVVRHPRYTISEKPGQIIARLRFLTGNDDDELFVKIPGVNHGDPVKTDGTEEVTDRFFDFEAGEWVEETHTLKTVEILLNVDLDVTTLKIPAKWDMGYSAYIQDGEYTTAYENINVESDRAIHTPVPYVRYYTAAPMLYMTNAQWGEFYKLMDEFIGEDQPLLPAPAPAPARRAPLVLDEDDPSVTEQDIENWWYNIYSKMYVIKSAWEVADWAKATLFNTFAYSRTDIPGFENASDPKYFGASNLVYRANIYDWMADEYFMGQGIYNDYEYYDGGIMVTNLPNEYNYVQHFSIPGFGYFVEDKPWSETTDLVSIMPVDVTRAAMVIDKLTLDQYLEAVGYEYYFSDFASIFPYAFDVQLGDAELDATAEEYHAFYNEIHFLALNALYTAKFDKSDRSVVIPFNGAAWEDEACETPATVRYFSAGYLTDDNKVTYKFSKKMRNGEPSNELSAGYPYLVWSDSGTSEFNVYFAGENTMVRRNSEDSNSGGLNEVVVDLNSSWGQTLTEGMMIGSYRYIYDYELFAEIGAEYFETMTEEDLAEMSFWERLAYEYQLEQYNQIEICRYSSYYGNPVKLDRTLLAEYAEDDKYQLNLLNPEKHSGIVPFHCALVFAGANNGNAGYSISIRYDEDDATVIVDNMAIENTSNAEMFDVMGRKITEPAKGQIYIQNGQKFIVK
ncbi:MAG: hypothetical protein IKH59_06245 [Bacteroidaceae bacterium]|nr:hypothetical protein [Bacteroidaceae bacterium]